MPDIPELKSCPFCGTGNPRYTENCMDNPAYSSVYIVCRVCGATTRHRHSSSESATRWWNTRSGKE